MEGSERLNLPLDGVLVRLLRAVEIDLHLEALALTGHERHLVLDDLAGRGELQASGHPVAFGADEQQDAAADGSSHREVQEAAGRFVERQDRADSIRGDDCRPRAWRRIHQQPIDRADQPMAGQGSRRYSSAPRSSPCRRADADR